VPGDSACVFCKIVVGDIATPLVFEDESTLCFLDHRPLFPGHVLLIPKKHFETLADLPFSLIEVFFSNVQILSQAVETAMEAEGTFIAMNNRVSQSVPHLHVHIVPRRRKDGLKGFFWPRTKYVDDQQREEVGSRIRAAIAKIKKSNSN
jgi:histidine triad (HIT) family protein